MLTVKLSLLQRKVRESHVIAVADFYLLLLFVLVFYNENRV